VYIDDGGWVGEEGGGEEEKERKSAGKDRGEGSRIESLDKRRWTVTSETHKEQMNGGEAGRV